VWGIKYTSLIIPALVGLLIFGLLLYQKDTRPDTGSVTTGVGGGPGLISSQPSPTPSISPTKTRLQLQALLTEHGIVTSNYLQTLYDGKDTTATHQAVENNNQKIKSFFDQYVGPEDTAALVEMWEDHIKGYENYTTALKDKDQVGADQARTDLAAGAAKSGELMHDVFETLNALQVQKLMQEHIDLTLSIVDLHSKGDTGSVLTKNIEASTQAAKFADYLANGIGRQ
jgi:hypothetical protein